MPAFNGVNIFGIAVQMRTARNPRATQQNTFFGTAGTETLDGGLKGRFTAVTGRLWGPSAQSLNAAILAFASFDNGGTATLVDMFGNAWPVVKLQSFEPQGRVQLDPDLGYTQRYQALFEHLV
jgi:hypothetical protein